MNEQPLKIFSFTNGYINTDAFAFPPDCLAPGSKNLFIIGQDSLRAFKGLIPAGQGSRVLFSTANGYAGLNDISNEATGSVFNFIGESLWFSGNGAVYLNGANTGFTATSLLQLAPKTGGVYPTAFTAGLAQPIAPTITAKAPSVGFTGILNGVYSFKIARVRSLTGAVSIASPTSQVVTFQSQTAVLQFPAASSNGQDRWAIFATKQGFGGTGVHYLVKEISETDLSLIGGLSRAYELEFADSDLLEITAYTDDFPPPACIFSAVLESYVLAIGCYDNCIAVSLSNFPESFNPENLLYLPKAPTAVLSSPIGSYLYIATESTVHAVSVTGDTNMPLAIQTVWSNVGVIKHHNWCAVEGILFAFVSQQGAVTMNAIGQPDNRFALPVAKEFATWMTEDTFVFYDPNISSVLYSNRAKGKILCFNLQNRKWMTPVETSDFFPGEIVSGVVVDRKLKLTLKNASIFNLYDWDQGTGTVAWKAVSPFWTKSLTGRMNIYAAKSVMHHAETVGNNVICKIYADNFLGIPVKIMTYSTVSGTNFYPKKRIFLPRKESVAVSLESTTTSLVESYPICVAVYGTLDQAEL